MKNRYEKSADGKKVYIFFNDGSNFVIDADDFETVSEFTWFKGKRGYPVAHTSRKSLEGYKTFTLHRLIFGFPSNYDIDHINGNKMDNRRDNLRGCNHQQNMFNQNKRSTNTSGFLGVSLMKNCGKFEAYIHPNGKKIQLGLFISAEEAAVARDKAAVQYFGSYARLNFPEL